MYEMEEKTMLEILNSIKVFLQKEQLYEAKHYLQLELDNLKGITQLKCQNTKYYYYDWYCKYCSNKNCSANKNIAND